MPDDDRKSTCRKIIDGKAIAAELRAAVAAEVQRIAALGVVPGLAVVLVGENPASAVYVRNKSKQTVEAGMRSFDHKLPEDAPERELLALVEKLNADPAVHGILVQLPLPQQIDSQKVLNAIDPAQGRGRIPSDECRPALDRVAGAHAVHAARLHPSRQVGARVRSKGWKPWWSAAPTSSASRWSSCC